MQQMASNALMVVADHGLLVLKLILVYYVVQDCLRIAACGSLDFSNTSVVVDVVY